MKAETELGPFSQNDEMGDLMRSTDWSKTPLGPMETWPRSLIAYVQMIMDLPSPAIIFWGPDQTQIYNAGYAVIMGPRHPRFFGAPYRECWPDTYQMIYPWMRKVLDNGETIRVEKELIPVTRYGFEEETYFTFTFSPLRDDAGQIAGILQPVFEVTDAVLSERRTDTFRALEPLSGSRDLSRDVMAALSKNPGDIPFALLFLRNGAEGELRLAGQTGELGEEGERAEERLRELAMQAIEGGESLEVVEKADRSASDGEAERRPASSALLIPLRQTSGEKSDGVIVFGRNPRLQRDDKYRNFLELVAGRVASAFDRTRTVQEMERQRQFLRDLFMQAPAYIAVLRGRDHVYELANPLYLQLVGGRDVIGKPIRTALPELEGQEVLEILDTIYRSGESFVGRELTVAVDREASGTAENVVFNLIYQPLKDASGQVEGILALAFEVTEQVQARRQIESLVDALREADRRKDEFLAMLAHELRNPLAVVRNAIHLLSQEETDETQRSALMAMLERQTGTLASMLDDLLDVSRITRGTIHLKQERIDLRRIVRQGLESVESSLRAKNHRVETRMPPSPIEVIGDAVRIEQALVNILGNAAKYTDPGGRIVLSLESCEGQAELRVKDNGIGLEPGTLDRIFTLFGQAERGLDRSEGGLGIGLTLAQSLVQLHHGDVSAFSEGIGQGSEFVIRLPLAAPTVEEGDDRPKPPLSKPTVRRRVLVVDDNRDAAQTLATLLKVQGHLTAVATDGAACLKDAESFEPDYILLDIGLPGMDGYEVARRLRQNSRTANVRLAALSGYSQPEDIRRARENGFDEYFVKPVAPAEIKAFLGNGTG